MYKIISSLDQENLVEQLNGPTVRFFDQDFSSIKRAASSAFSENFIRSHLPDKKHFGMHNIAMGSGEFYGANKNADFWEEKELQDRHDTFVKRGRAYREHDHDHPSKAIGKIAASGWNDEMKRVELILHIDKEKAEDLYEKAKKGNFLSTSMSAKVPFDRCNCCGNEAKSSKHYCVCMKKHANQYIKKYGKFAFVRNPRPTFFDDSVVENPADRIAHALEYRFNDDMKKAAVEGQFIFSDQLAAAAGVKLDTCLDDLRPATQKWLKKLAALEDHKTWSEELQSFYKHAARFFTDHSLLTDAQLEKLRTIEPSAVFYYLAKSAAVLPFLDFFAYSTKETLKQASANTVYHYARHVELPTIFQDLAAQPVNADLEDMFLPASSSKLANLFLPHNSEHLLHSLGEAYAVLTPKLARERALHLCHPGNLQLEAELKKSASDFNLTPEQQAQGKLLAQSYGFYKIAFCESVATLHGDQFLSDAGLLLTLAQF